MRRRGGEMGKGGVYLYPAEDLEELYKLPSTVRGPQTHYGPIYGELYL